MSGIKNIVFDFGGVLIEWNPRHVFRKVFNDDVKMEFFLTHICSTAWNEEHDRGRPFAEGVRLLQAEHPEYSKEIAMYSDRWVEMLNGALPGVELLREWKAEGKYRLYGLTNWAAETFPVAYDMYDFFKLFDGIVVSGEEKLIKPDPRIFEVLLERYDIKAEETIFIDDNAVNIAAAQKLGFKGVLFDTLERVRPQLAALLA